MSEEKFSDRMKKAGGCALFGLAGFLLVSIALIVGGFYAYFVLYEDMGIICAIFGIFSFLFFGGIFILLPFIQWKKGITVESKREWKSGVLTSKIIKKDINASGKIRILCSLLTLGLLLVIAGVIFAATEELDGDILFIAAVAIVLLGYAVYQWILMNKAIKYHIAEDRVIGTEVVKTFGVVDAVTNHLPTETPTLYFEKYGKYDIDCTHIHSYYMPVELMTYLDGEEVYLVLSPNGKILHIYLKKYWSL